MKSEKNVKLTVLCYPQKDGGYCVICPEIDRATQGETIEEAQFMIKELIDDYFEHEEENDFTREDIIEAFNYGNKVITEITV